MPGVRRRHPRNPRPALPDPRILAAVRAVQSQPGQRRRTAGLRLGRAGGLPPPAPPGRDHAGHQQAPGSAQPRQRAPGGGGGRGGPAALGGRRSGAAAPGRRHDVRPRRRLVRSQRWHQRTRNGAGPGPRHPDLRRGALPAGRAPVELHRRSVPRSRFRRRPGCRGHYRDGHRGGAAHVVAGGGHGGRGPGAAAGGTAAARGRSWPRKPVPTTVTRPAGGQARAGVPRKAASTATACSCWAATRHCSASKARQLPCPPGTVKSSPC